MTTKINGALLAVFLLTLTTPVRAANKEHQQLMADIRMLQEQAQQLQNMLGALNEALKSVNARIDEQTNTTRKAFADEKLQIDNVSSDLRVVRERTDDSNVQVTSLRQQIDQLRQMIQQMNARPATSNEPSDVPATGTNAPPQPAGGVPAGATPPESAGPPAAAIGTSPDRLYQMAWASYTSGQYDLAIDGFEAYIRSFPTAVDAPQAQILVGNSYLQDGKYDKAAEAYDKAIRNYPASPRLAEAYFKKGLSLAHLGQMDRAREAWQTVIQKYANSAEASLAQQQLNRKP
jgi:tol-pal system protein YbgF